MNIIEQFGISPETDNGKINQVAIIGGCGVGTTHIVEAIKIMKQ